ncbi:motility associated factor glycosyltransferase family protein [Maribrevibacterium harenarium]|uniref:Motility associated factor glycosyltransferase family protein n=1 Tax=Maribrevibacterium harenarium TaxID=2589817 RepID=A0A501X348_9GAMM|nr:6-hydroxymethylpterin diphosphokinase MptE-like protein [Maribrevibacterium harenarium]TPE54912.1 motility associated factor glycosyltransferase family protein [Maribrevibacterium harenarium]
MSDSFEGMLQEASIQVEKLEKRYKLAIELDRTLNDRFRDNLLAFEHYMPHVLEDYKSFSFDENLLFMSDTGTLNILHPELKQPLYGEDPISASKQQFQAYKKSPKFTRIRYGQEDNPRNQLQTEYLNKVAAFCLEAETQLTPLKQLPDYVPNLLILGIGLGYHLDELLEELNSNHFYIYEPVPEFFWASLMVFNWRSLFERVNEQGLTLNINIGSKPEQFPRDYISQLDLNGRYSASKTFLYLHYHSDVLERVISELHANYNKQITGWGFFDDGVFSVGHGLTNLENEVPILKEKNHISKEIFDKIVDMPVFIVANGPSLDNCIETIKEYRDQVILMSCGSTITTLYRYGIKPDIQLDVERTKHSADKFDYLPASYLEDILALSVNVMHPKYFKYFKRKGYGMKPGETMSSIFSDKIDPARKFAFLQACNPLVGNIALSYSYYFGFRNVYLMGMDNGFVKGGLHHSKNSIYYTAGNEDVKALQNYVEHDGVTVPGNFGRDVFSSHLMDYSRYMINVIMREVAKNKRANYYNCSDGAKFESITPLSPEDVFLLDPPLDHEAVKKYIFENFFEVLPLSSLDIQALAGREEFAKVVNALISKFDMKLETRADFSLLAKKQIDFVKDFRKLIKGSSYIYYLLVGSLNTFNAMMLTMVYDYEEEQECIKRAKQMLSIWQEYLEAMVVRYDQVIGYHDVYDWDGMKLFKDDTNGAATDDA